MQIQLAFFLVLLFSCHTRAAFSNYNSPLVGERSSGMGGAAVALAGDASADAFYNPASLARMTGNTVAGSISTYQKADTTYGNSTDFQQAGLRANQGYFRPISAASGYIQRIDDSFLGLSIVVPDFDFFNGEVGASASDGSSSTLNFSDESLWVGGAFARKVSPNEYMGITAYYTARNYSRSVSDKQIGATNAVLYSEEKTIKSNSVVLILGYQMELSDKWTLGISARPPDIPISGTGTYYRSNVQTNPYQQDVVTDGNLHSRTMIPAKIGLGLAYEQKSHYTISLETDWYSGEEYNDMDTEDYADLIRQQSIINVALGTEIYFLPWLKWRGGIYTNYSSNLDPDVDLKRRQGDRVNQVGFSANLAATTKQNITYTFGGFYSGGNGSSLQYSNGELKKTVRSQQLFSMLIGFSYAF